MFHARLVPGGFIGVDIFYVISGYLITGLILREIDKTGRLDLQSFYQRRIKRLLPTSVFVLFITAVIGLFVLPAITRDALGRDLFAAATYISNYFFAWWQNDYQNLNATPSPFIHYWSLAVEEQFYVVWPIFILLLSRFGKKAVPYGVAVSSALSLLLSIYQTQTSPIWAFYSLPTRAWELGVGALLLFIPEKVFKNRLIPWIGFSGLMVAAFLFGENTAFPGINAILPVSATALLIGSISNWSRAFNLISNSRISQWLGAISYPLYLWHWPALVLPSTALGRPLWLHERVLCIGMTIFLAHLTSKFIEEPIRNKEIARGKVYLFFASTTVISLIAGLAISASAASTINIKGTEYKFDLASVINKPTVYSDGCHVNFAATESGKCTYGYPTATTTIVLFGDSHAAQWFPTLEKLALEAKFRLVVLTKSSCPSVDVPLQDQGAFKNVPCEKWRANAIARIKAIHPVAVIMSSFQYYTPPPSYLDRNKWWIDGQHRLLSKLSGASDHLIYISDTPRPLQNIPNCLAARELKSCDGTKRSTVETIKGFTKIDPTPWLCSKICPAVLNGYVVYRDASHISVAAALALKPQLKAALIAKGLFS